MWRIKQEPLLTHAYYVNGTTKRGAKYNFDEQQIEGILDHPPEFIDTSLLMQNRELSAVIEQAPVETA